MSDGAHPPVRDLLAEFREYWVSGPGSRSLTTGQRPTTQPQDYLTDEDRAWIRTQLTVAGGGSP